jgi:hypothetical protein
VEGHEKKKSLSSRRCVHAKAGLRGARKDVRGHCILGSQSLVCAPGPRSRIGLGEMKRGTLSASGLVAQGLGLRPPHVGMSWGRDCLEGRGG